MSFGLQVFHVDLVHTEFRNEPFIGTTGLDCSDSVNHDWVQDLSYCKYSLLFLPAVGIEPATFRWFHSEALSNQTPYPLHHMSLPDISDGIFLVS